MQGTIVEINYFEKKAFINCGGDNTYLFYPNAVINNMFDGLCEGDAVEFNLNDNMQVRSVKKIKVDTKSVTRPGLNKHCKFNNFTEEERKIIDCLAQVFYVTHTNGGNYIKVSETSKYKYCLIKPAGQFIHQFNIEREILVVFSEFDSFEPRTLDAISYVYDRLPLLRIDRSCAVLISKDKAIADRVTTLLKSDVNMMSIVPVSYDDVIEKGGGSDYFLKLFRKYFYERDLFDFDQAISNDLFFFGRRDYVNELYNRCKTSENSGVFGMRKTGKTSVLLALIRLLDKNNDAYLKIDCQTLYTLKWNNVLYKIVDKIRKKYTIQKQVNRCDYDEEMAGLVFEEDMIETLASLGKSKITIIFDEIEHLTHSVSSEDRWATDVDYINFWRAVRSFFQNHHDKFVFILAGTNPKMIEMPYVKINDRSVENPMFNGVHISYLKPFDFEHTKSMINTLGGYMGLRFNEEVCNALCQELGGHPFLIRQYCSLINSHINENNIEKPIEVTKPIYDRMKMNFAMGKGRSYSVMILDVLLNHYKDEYFILENLAANNYDKVRELVSNSMAISHLIGYGIIEENSGSFGFKLNIINNYLKDKNKYIRMDLSNEDKLAEINERRNSFEPKLRKLIKLQLQSRYGTEEGKKKVLYSIQKKRKCEFYSKPYEEIFDGLLLSEMIKIISNNWECFEKLFKHSKDEMISYLNLLNNYRRPAAHGTKITNNDFENFRLVMSKLETIVYDK